MLAKNLGKATLFRMSSEELTPWPNDLARRYREKGYWTDETLGGFLVLR
jgi:non-ribosomal peptide synthetase component E (peptide arylation enzyme)